MNSATFRNRTWGVGTSVAGMVLAPIVVSSAYLVVTRSTPLGFSTLSDYGALGVGVVAGALFIPLLRLRIWIKVAAALVYVPLTFDLLFYYSLGFVCGVYGDCL